MKHRKGYFKGKYHAYAITAYSSLRKISEPVNNKIIAKELGISTATLYRIKAGSNISDKTKEKLNNFFAKEYTLAGKLSKEGNLFYKAIEKIRKNNPKGKKLKELTRRQILNLSKKKKESFEIYLDNLYEAFYE